MKNTLLIYSLKPVRSEEVPLRNNEVLREPVAMQSIEIRERACKAW